MFVLAFAVFAVVGFSVGWMLKHQQTEISGQAPMGRTAGTVAPSAMPNTSIEEVPEEVSGSDLADLPRYPGSIRVDHEREVLNGLIHTRLEYEADAELDAVREFYRDVFRSEGWSVADFDFSGSEWTFFVISEEREAFVDLKPRADAVEIELEISEPHNQRDQRGADSEPPSSPDALPQETTPQPVPSTPPSSPEPGDYFDEGDDIEEDDSGEDDLGEDD